MAEFDNENLKGSALIPQDGASNILLPISLDTDTGSSQSAVIRTTLTVVAAVGYLLYFFAIIFRSDKSIIIGLLDIMFWGAVVLLTVRFLINQEYTLRKEYSLMISNGNKIMMNTLWGISSVDSEYHHVVTFNNGALGSFIELVSDTIVGKPINDEYLSYEAIAEAMREAHRVGIQVEHYDVMDFIGSDARTSEARTLLANRCSNPVIKNTISRMLNYLDTEMSYRVYSRDIYRFVSYNQNELVFKSNLDSICKKFLSGNYKKYHFLDQSEIGNVLESVYGFTGFSVNQAIKDSYVGHLVPGITPLECIYPDGRTKVLHNNTSVKQSKQKIVNNKSSKHGVKKNSRKSNTKSKFVDL